MELRSYEHLRPWAITDRQHELLDALSTGISQRHAARQLGVNESTVRAVLRRLANKAAKQGMAPECDMTKLVPDGYVVKGVSTYYDKAGRPAGQWVKSSIDADRMQEIMREIADAMAQELPRYEPRERAELVHEELINTYVFTDCHVGMLAWAKETQQEDWDLSIAERTLLDAFKHLIFHSPAAHTGVIAQMGDFLHWDGLLAVTPTNKNPLDADGRFARVVSVAVTILREMVAWALMKHERVILLLAEGNHDMASSVWLRVMFRALFENEPRVEVVDSELPYYCIRWGNTMLGFHHGHMKKLEQLPLLFAAQFSETWGQTTKRFVHVGHWHHTVEQEHAGITVVQHRTLAARDAYASRGGWYSDREAQCITYHSKYGQVGRTIVSPEMLKD